MATLPEDIILDEILPRSPAESLLRFKLVSKSFYNLISSSKFTLRHLHHSLSSDANRFLVTNLFGDIQFYTIDDESSIDILPPSLDMITYSTSDVTIMGSCNGLLLLLVDGCYPDREFMLINPTTRIQFTLPDPDHGLKDCLAQVYGFGYDSLIDDYKTVIVTDRDTKDRGLVRDVEVYSLKSNKWDLVDTIVSPSDAVLPKAIIDVVGVLIDGYLLHWIFSCPAEKKIRIGCFNVRSEKWDKDVPLPSVLDTSILIGAHSANIYRDKRKDLVELGVLDGCLCFMARNMKYDTTDVWVMRVYGVEESWVILLGVSDSVVTKSLCAAPLAYRRGSKSEILLRLQSRNDDLQIVWYNIKDKRYEAQFDNEDRELLVDEAYVGKGSLVALPRGEKLFNGNFLQP